MCKKRIIGNTLGAFSDGAILFPLVALMATGGGYSLSVLLGTAGIFYILAGSIYRVPMSIQPLKAIAIGAIAIGANSVEIRISGFLLALYCLLAVFYGLDKLASKIPKHYIHGVQLALGVLLICKGLNISWGEVLLNGNKLSFILSILLALSIFALSRISEFPFFGLLGTVGIIWAILMARTLGVDNVNLASSTIISGSFFTVRPLVILSLVLPQIVLTSANSVIATADVSSRYFGDKARRVTVRNLFLSIGFGNIISSFVGGLPFCHGSGGITAHVRGGAKDWSSNIIIGTALLLLVAYQNYSGSFWINFPPILLSSLLIAVGGFHLLLAEPSWKDISFRPVLIGMGFVALLTSNMFYVLIFAIVFETCRRGVLDFRKVGS